MIFHSLKRCLMHTDAVLHNVCTIWFKFFSQCDRWLPNWLRFFTIEKEIIRTESRFLWLCFDESCIKLGCVTCLTRQSVKKNHWNFPKKYFANCLKNINWSNFNALNALIKDHPVYQIPSYIIRLPSKPRNNYKKSNYS